MALSASSRSLTRSSNGSSHLRLSKTTPPQTYISRWLCSSRCSSVSRMAGLFLTRSIMVDSRFNSLTSSGRDDLDEFEMFSTSRAASVEGGASPSPVGLAAKPY
jgi:hypothetical protein